MTLLFLLYLKLCFIATSVETKTDYRNKQPNIIVILADDLGWSDVSWNNQKVHTTPFMEQMARNGTMLTQAYSTHRCSPTRAALLTGRYPWRFGLGSDPITCTNPVGLELNEWLLPELFKEESSNSWKQGYATHMIGKWHLGNCNEAYLPFNRGFDSFYGHYGGALDYFNHTKLIRKVPYLDYFVGSTPNSEKNGVYSTFDFGDQASKIFMDGDKPKFIYLAFNAPHDPVSAPEDLIAEMKTAHPTVSHSRAVYLASIKAIDMAMEKLVAAIKAKNEVRDTIIIFQSDNGATTFIMGERHGCNYPYKGEKTLLTEGGTLVPSFIYSIKNTIVDRVYDGVFHVTDWFPTIMSLAKMPNKVKQINLIDGIDQSAVLTNLTETADARTEMVYGMIDRKKNGVWETKFALRIGDYKFYNYKFDAPTTRCEEGYQNTRIAKMLTRRLGTSKYKKLRFKLRNNSTSQDLARSKTYAGFSVFNLRDDPYELTDLSSKKKVIKTVAAEVGHNVVPIDDFVSECIKKEHDLGYMYPVTGPNYAFWQKILTFFDSDRVLDFMSDSGRLANDVNGTLVTGTSYCSSSEDPKLLADLINNQKEKVRQKLRKPKTLKYLQGIITKQFEFGPGEIAPLNLG